MTFPAVLRRGRGTSRKLEKRARKKSARPHFLSSKTRAFVLNIGADFIIHSSGAGIAALLHLGSNAFVRLAAATNPAEEA